MSEFQQDGTLGIEDKQDHPQRVKDLTGTDSKFYYSAEELNKIKKGTEELNQTKASKEDLSAAAKGFENFANPAAADAFFTANPPAENVFFVYTDPGASKAEFYRRASDNTTQLFREETLTEANVSQNGISPNETGLARSNQSFSKIQEKTIPLNLNFHDGKNYLDTTDEYYGEGYLDDDNTVVTSSSYVHSGEIALATGEVFYIHPAATGNANIVLLNDADEIVTSYLSNLKRYATKDEFPTATKVRFSARKIYPVIFKSGEIPLEKKENTSASEVKNLLNPNALGNISGFISNTNGSLNASAIYDTTDFIDLDKIDSNVLRAKYLGIDGAPLRAFRFLNYYTKDFVWINGVVNDADYSRQELSKPATARYSRISYEKSKNTDRKNDLIIYDGKYDTLNLQDRKLQEAIKPKALFPVEVTANTGYYSDAGEVANASWQSVEFTPQFGKRYYISTFSGSSVPADLNWLTTIDDSDEILFSNNKSVKYKGITFEKEVAKVIVSYRTTFEAPIILVESINSLENYNISNTDLTGGVDYAIGEPNFKKNSLTIYSYAVFDTFTSFKIGKGLDGPSGDYSFANITPGFAYLRARPGIGGLNENQPHNLTITGYLAVTIQVNEINIATLNIKTEGGEWTSAPFIFFGNGEMYITPGSDCTIYQAGISFNDASRPVWFYGDSYSSTNSVKRWTHQALNRGARFMTNGLSGGTTLDVLPQLLRDFKFGMPKYILWGLGMNDTSDTGSLVPDPIWKMAVDTVKNLCDILDIEFIPITIPSVPTRSHTGKAKYVRDNFIKYVDFAAAVDNEVDTDWKDDLLDFGEATAVHPTELGAIVLAMQALSNVSELLQK